MPVDWIWGLVGGLAIGLAATFLLLMNGTIMGVSGVLGGLVDRTGWKDWPERSAFLIGTLALPILIVPGIWDTATHLTGNWVVIVAAGLLVGVGTRLANGCTSGHGVCGISRLSLRGIVATVFYVIAGGIMLATMRHLWGVI
ncbi:MAG: YeeE/YedE family protein [Paracoccaceae bacterium]